MPLTLIALSKVDDKDAGLASSLVNTGQVVGGSIGLAIPAVPGRGLGTSPGPGLVPERREVTPVSPG